ncbi:remorin isoform X2 [Morus notabilis]|uniref:remorin isoform X2 n=1 Tax=Morus notabilis TaxID=981085 RepID=UPI000CED4C2D|nr:remorin isoform X2 [Morus notabilis]
MDDLFRQTRFSGTRKEKKEESGSGRDQSIPPPKPQPFKDKKKEQNWFQRKFSRQMSRDYDSSNGDEQGIAVAAAAYAISSLEEFGTPDQKQRTKEPGTSTVATKSKKEDGIISIPDSGKDSKRFSGESSMKSFENQDSKVPVTAEKALPPADKPPKGSFKKSSGSFKLGSKKSKPDLPTTAKPAPPPAETRRQSSTRPGTEKSQADIWEQAELARITERYEKQQSTIHSWEDKKKKKAKRRLDKQERELESKGAKAMQRFRSNIEHIDQTAGGARAKAEEKKRNDVFKVKEKANIIRKTGKVPKTCFCF